MALVPYMSLWSGSFLVLSSIYRASLGRGKTRFGGMQIGPKEECEEYLISITFFLCLHYMFKGDGRMDAERGITLNLVA